MNDIQRSVFTYCENGNHTRLKEFLQKNPKIDVDFLHSNGFTPLHMAARQGHEICVKYLIKHGANLWMKNENDKGKQAIHFAAECDHPEVVKRLLDKEPRLINEADYDQAKPVHLACSNNAVKVLKKIDLKNQLREVGKDGYLPVHYAAEKGYSDVLDVLLKEGLCPKEPVNSVNKKQAIHIASAKGHTKFVEVLLSKEVSVKEKDAKGKEPVHYAAETNAAEMLKFLFRKDADLTVQCNDGKAPACYARDAQPQARECLEFLRSKHPNTVICHPTEETTQPPEVPRNNNMLMLHNVVGCLLINVLIMAVFLSFVLILVPLYISLHITPRSQMMLFRP